jgi:hypothetical protein
LWGIHGKGSYVEVVVGKGQEQAAEQRILAQAIMQSQNTLGGDQPPGDHAVGKGEETLIQEGVDDKLPGTAPVDHAGNNGEILLQLITEGNIMAIHNMLIGFKEEINSCLEKLEVGQVSSRAGQKMGQENNKMTDLLAKSWAHVAQD